jgi:hypothetical protein
MNEGPKGSRSMAPLRRLRGRVYGSARRLNVKRNLLSDSSLPAVRWGRAIRLLPAAHFPVGREVIIML